jgi:hypothetical protein
MNTFFQCLVPERFTGEYPPSLLKTDSGKYAESVRCTFNTFRINSSQILGSINAIVFKGAIYPSFPSIAIQSASSLRAKPN